MDITFQVGISQREISQAGISFKEIGGWTEEGILATNPKTVAFGSRMEPQGLKPVLATKEHWSQ